jgi:hypothetical protein
MDGAQFHPPWVGDAGGELTRNKDASSTKQRKTAKHPFHLLWVGNAGGELKRNYFPWMVQVVDSTRKTILGRISVRPYGTEVLCSTPTQDCAALVLGYFRFLPPGEWVPAVSPIGVGEAGGRLQRNRVAIELDFE